MKIIVDTNVFVSGIFWSGPPYQILQAWRDGHLDLVLSPEIFEEYQRVFLELQAQYPQLEAQPFIDLVTLKANFCDPVDLPQPICRDPDDDKFLACALGAKVKYLISSDKDLLVLSGIKGLKFLSRGRLWIDSRATGEYASPWHYKKQWKQWSNGTRWSKGTRSKLQHYDIIDLMVSSVDLPVVDLPVLDHGRVPLFQRSSSSQTNAWTETLSRPSGSTVPFHSI